MRLHERSYGVALALALLLVACTGGSDDVAAPTVEPVEDPTATAVVEDDPTPTAAPQVPVVSDEDRIAVVVDALNAAIEEGDAPEGLIAYDLLDSAIDEDGDVTLTICGWTGDTVFDTVRDSLWRTSVDDDGGVTATHVTSPLTSGDCLNSHLIETALETVADFDAFWIALEADPALLQTSQIEVPLTVDFAEFLAEFADESVANGVAVQASRRAGPPFEDLQAEVLWRRMSTETGPFLEIVFCREMEPTYGLYRDGVLIDDGKPAEGAGPHSIDAIQLQPELEEVGGWKLAGRDALIWADCTSVEDWPQAASSWRQSQVDFSVLDRP